MPVEPLSLFPFADLNAHRAEYDYIADNELNSLYDTHRDGSGVRYASWKRPLVNLRPKAIFRIYGAPERLGADLYLIHWLERKGIAYDTIADENLHARGGGAARSVPGRRHRHSPGVLDASRCSTRSIATSTTVGG